MHARKILGRRWLLVGILLLTSALVGFVCLWHRHFFVWFGKPSVVFGSCRNHATSVGAALDEYVSNQHALPYVPGIAGEELICHLDFHDHELGLLNCHMGAPGQGFGGWQMVNASPTSWNDILVRLKGERIPVVWCGKPHSVPERNSDSRIRVVITIDQSTRQYSSIGDLVRQASDESGRMDYFWFGISIVYGMEERELVANLALVNEVLRANGEPETPLNVEGRKDYAKIAGPFQSLREE